MRTHRSTITVLGWPHITDDSSVSLYRGLQATLSSHFACADVKNNLRTLISSHANEFDQYNQMLGTLTQLLQLDSAARVGVEQTPTQLQSHQVGIKNLRDLLGPLVQRCGSVVADEIHLIIGVLFGPDHQVANTLNRQVVAVENEEEKNNNYLDFQVVETFNYDDPRITADGQAAISLIRHSILALSVPNENLINRVVVFEANSVRRSELKRNLYLSINRWIEIMRGAYERNTFIAHQLLNSDTPIVLPIGYLHVNDLKKQLSQICHQ